MDDYDDDLQFDLEITANDVLAMFKQLRSLGSIDDNGDVVDDGAVIVINNDGFEVFINEH